jgi:ketosteroid isomerase-like protein
MRRLLASLVFLASISCMSAGPSQGNGRGAVDAVLDDFHRAASAADESRYFSHFAPDGVFFGTDGAERWGVDAFRAYAHPHFAKGTGWTFTPRDRSVYFSSDGFTAWFDEALDSASYGACRGTGVLQKVAGQWKIEQYNLSIPIPNGLAKEVVRQIREVGKKN